jgi:hypothetical protein
VHKGSTQTNKKIKVRVQKERSKRTKECPGLAHRTVRCATGQCLVHQDRTSPNSSPSGFSKRHSAIIHRIVRCATRLTGVTAKQRLFSATVGCTVPLTALQFTAEVRAEVRGAPYSEQCLSGAAPDCLVPLEDKAPTIKTARTLTVG